MALANHTDLSNAISVWMMKAKAPETNADTIIRLAESMFRTGYNDGMITVPPIRSRYMTAKVVLNADSNNEYTIPTNYEMFRRVVALGNYRNTLAFMTLNEADETYAVRPEGGRADHFTIENTTLRIYPETGEDVELTYYQKIPALTAQEPTNWLITEFPNVYLSSCLMFAADLIKDDKDFAKHSRASAGYINGLSTQDDLAEYASAAVHIEGFTP